MANNINWPSTLGDGHAENEVGEPQFIFPVSLATQEFLVLLLVPHI